VNTQIEINSHGDRHSGKFKVAGEKRSAPLRDCVQDAMRHYFRQLGNHPVNNLYQMVIAEVEAPLLRVVMDYTEGNQTRAAGVLGMSRSTLRKKLALYDLTGD